MLSRQRGYSNVASLAQWLLSESLRLPIGSGEEDWQWFQQWERRLQIWRIVEPTNSALIDRDSMIDPIGPEVWPDISLARTNFRELFSLCDSGYTFHVACEGPQLAGLAALRLMKWEYGLPLSISATEPTGRALVDKIHKDSMPP